MSVETTPAKRPHFEPLGMIKEFIANSFKRIGELLQLRQTTTKK